MPKAAFAQNVNIAVEPVSSISLATISTIVFVVLAVIGAIAYISWYYKKTKNPEFSGNISRVPHDSSAVRQVKGRFSTYLK